jgi:hypothetical protein
MTSKIVSARASKRSRREGEAESVIDEGLVIEGMVHRIIVRSLVASFLQTEVKKRHEQF